MHHKVGVHLPNYFITLSRAWYTIYLSGDLVYSLHKSTVQFAVFASEKPNN